MKITNGILQTYLSRNKTSNNKKKSLSKLERLFLFKMISNFQITIASKANVTLLLLQGLYN